MSASFPESGNKLAKLDRKRTKVYKRNGSKINHRILFVMIAFGFVCEANTFILIFYRLMTMIDDDCHFRAINFAKSICFCVTSDLDCSCRNLFLTD